jgi:hypothetical protein
MDFLRDHEEEPAHRTAFARTRFLFDLVRAVLYLGCAIVIYQRKPAAGLAVSESFIQGFAIVIGIYGLFRLWRAWYASPFNKKSSFRTHE